MVGALRGAVGVFDGVRGTGVTMVGLGPECSVDGIEVSRGECGAPVLRVLAMVATSCEQGCRRSWALRWTV